MVKLKHSERSYGGSMKRILYFDNLKGLLILFVILVHTITVCSSHFGFDRSVFKIIMFFLIPLFIFITGVFAKKSKRTPFKRAVKMLIIYIVLQILITIYYTYVLHIINPTKSILIPRFTLWYLLTCVYLYLAEYLFRNYKFKPVFITSLILALLIGFVKPINDTLSFTRTITGLPFFILGYYSEEINILKLTKKYKSIILTLTIIITIWFLFNRNFFLFKDTYLKYNYFSYRTPGECFIKRCLIYIVVFVYSSFILNVVPKGKNFLTYLGSRTLIIYILHGVLLKTIHRLNLFISNPIVGTIIVYFLVLFLCLIIEYLFSKFNKIINKNFNKKQSSS